MLLNLVAVRVGERYGPEYVSNLFDMLLRNLSAHEGEVRCWCITDVPDELPEGVTAIAHDPDLPGWWQKIALFSPSMPWGRSERVAYFDLDVAITGRLEDLVQTKGIIQDWAWPCYNSSVMVWDHGEHSEVYAKLNEWPDVIHEPGTIVPPECLPSGQVNGGDQEWITEHSLWETFPSDWCVSYRSHAAYWPPAGAKVVCFNGEPKPHEVTDGWVPDVWRIDGLTSLPEMRGVNVSRDVILDNVRENVKRDLPWFTGALPHSRTYALCCGGPSLAQSVPAIRQAQKRGVRIVTVNNTLRFLQGHQITSDAHIMLDARPENAEFLTDAPQRPQYFLASQCDPSLFDKLKDRNVTVWHNAIDNAGIEEICEAHETPDRPAILVPGGCTIGLRGIWLAFISGCRKLHIYGMDGSYAAEKHHAYSQPLNDGEELMTVAMGGKRYTVSKWMARQASEFQKTYREATAMGMTIWVHGEGLIPDMARVLREEAA